MSNGYQDSSAPGPTSIRNRSAPRLSMVAAYLELQAGGSSDSVSPVAIAMSV